MTIRRGSAKPGPSKTYVRLLQGKITSERYAQTVTRSAAVNGKAA